MAIGLSLAGASWSFFRKKLESGNGQINCPSPSRPLPGSNPHLLPLSTLPAFLCSWPYLFFSQLRVLLNLLFFWLPELVPRHFTPCPAHDKNAWERSASHIPPLSEHPVLNAPREAAFLRLFPTAATPPLSQWSGGNEGPMAERTPRKDGNLGNLVRCPRPVLSSQSLKRDINRLPLSVCVEG